MITITSTRREKIPLTKRLGSLEPGTTFYAYHPAATLRIRELFYRVWDGMVSLDSGALYTVDKHADLMLEDIEYVDLNIVVTPKGTDDE